MVQAINPLPPQSGEVEVIFLDEGYNYLESQAFESGNHLVFENHAHKLAMEHQTLHIVVLVRLTEYHFEERGL
jgi:hypothetical protein